MKYFIIYLLLINIITFVVYGIDKRKAIKHKWRVPERTLLILAAIGGSVGALFGMFGFHHKTKHKKFTITVPILAVLWCVIILYVGYRFGAYLIS